MAYMTIDTDIDVDEFWNASSDYEREALKDLVCDEYNLPTDDRSPERAFNALMDILGEGADSIEAREYVQRVAKEVAYKLKMRDFS